MPVSSGFVLGLDPCTVVRVGVASFHVYYENGFGVLELLDLPRWGLGAEAPVAYWNGDLFDTSGFLGLWDLLDLGHKEFHCFESERDLIQ